MIISTFSAITMVGFGGHLFTMKESCGTTTTEIMLQTNKNNDTYDTNKNNHKNKNKNSNGVVVSSSAGVALSDCDDSRNVLPIYKHMNYLTLMDIYASTITFINLLTGIFSNVSRSCII